MPQSKFDTARFRRGSEPHRIVSSVRLAVARLSLTNVMEESSLSKQGQSKFLGNLSSRQSPHYVTEMGEAWAGDSRKLLKKLGDESIDLVVTSPPYGLIKQKQ